MPALLYIISVDAVRDQFGLDIPPQARARTATIYVASIIVAGIIVNSIACVTALLVNG